jgi:hypothetical protein
VTHQAADRIDREARESDALIASYREGREARLLGRELALTDSAYLRAGLVRWYQHRARRAVRRGRRLRRAAASFALLALLLGGQGCAARRSRAHAEITLLPPIVVARAEVEVKETSALLRSGDATPDVTARASIEVRWGGPATR